MRHQLPTALPSPAATPTRSVEELDRAWEVWPRGDRLPALRDAGRTFKRRFKAGGQVVGVRSLNIASAPYPVAFGFHGAARAMNPYISIVNRMVIVQFTDFAGAARTLVWEPTVPAGSEQAPFYKQLVKQARGNPLMRAGRRVVNRNYNTLETALATAGVRAECVDYFAFDHLHVQDPRMILPAFPNARMLVQNREMATLESLHPMQWAWYVDGGAAGIDEARLLRIDGSVELGAGLAIVATPGHTDGNQSLVLNTAEGVWVSSENGICADNWQPEQSNIPGVRRYAHFYGREICPNANTLEDALDQYDSMVLEKTLADPCASNPHWLQILPSSELAPWRFQWPIIPTFHHGPLNTGRVDSNPLPPLTAGTGLTSAGHPR